MLFKTVFLIVGLSQVLALPTESTYTEVEFIENVFEGDSELYAEPSDTRIVSGWQAYPGQHPHQIYLRTLNALGQLSACGGSVVHEHWFITAAHCTAQRVRLLVRAGLVHIAQAQYDSETTLWYNHPTYDDSRPGVVQPNDMSIAYLPQPITFSHLLQPIRIQPLADAYKDYTGETVIASGFGRTWTNGATSEHLMWVFLTGVSNTACFGLFGSVVNDASVCARFYNVTSQSTCQGDSGGPLVHVGLDGVPILIGVSTFVAGGASGCHAGYPAGFTRPGPFHSWFTELTGIDFDNLEEESTVAPTTQAPTTTEAPATTEAPTTTEVPTTTENPTTTEPPPTTEPPTESPDSEEEDDEEDTSEETEQEEDTSEETDSDESDDCELSELLKKLEVKVSVKVKLNKYGKKKKH